MRSQEEFVRNLRNGLESSFADLYATYGTQIYSLAYRIVGDKEDAKDITQETFLQVYRSIHRFEEKSQLSTWMYTIAKRLCYRVAQRQKKQSFAAFEAFLESTPSHAVPPEITQSERRLLMNQVKEGCLTGLIRCLSFYQRLAFILHVLGHVSIKEVATILDKSEGATKVLIHRARQNLKTFLCRHCSAYRQDNPCRCENFIHFSLANGWITRSPQDESRQSFSAENHRIEDEIEQLTTVTELYRQLPAQVPPTHVRQRIRHMLTQQQFIIFSDKKV